MDHSAASAIPAEELIFRDGLGDRLLIRDTGGQPLHESLLLRPDLSGVPSFEFSLNDRRADVAGVGMIALALFAGRPLRASEHLGNLGEALMGLTLPDAIKTWLLRTLHLDARRAYVSAAEAAQGLEDAVAESGVRP